MGFFQQKEQAIQESFSPDLVPIYERAKSEVSNDEWTYKEQFCISLEDVLKAHFIVADFFKDAGEGIGGIGPKSMNLLSSACHRQSCGYQNESKWDNKFDRCATLFYGIIKDHPFHDANKRTALLTLLYQLETMGYVPTLKQKQLENFAVCVANNTLNSYPDYKRFKKFRSDKDVKFISYFIKRNTRIRDAQHYSITFRQLKRILNRFGYDLAPVRKTAHIDVVKVHSFLGKKNIQKIVQIGFPRWGAQVNLAALKTVRKECKLLPEDGIDSKTFFKDEDILHCLVAEYRKPLARLADR